MPKKKVMPDLTDLTNKQIIDRLGEVKEVRKNLESEEKYYREALLANIHKEDGVYTGGTYAAVIETREASRLNTALIRKDMDADWIEAHTTESKSQFVTLKRIQE